MQLDVFEFSCMQKVFADTILYRKFRTSARRVYIPLSNYFVNMREVRWDKKRETLICKRYTHPPLRDRIRNNLG